MHIPRLLALLVLSSGLLRAETPLFSDGTAFGGSKVFSQGLNPLSNPARLDQVKGSAMLLSYVDGDVGTKDFNRGLAGLLDTTLASAPDLSVGAWGTRTRAYGVGILANTFLTTLTREEITSLVPHPAVAGQTPAWIDRSRVKVDRFCSGSGSLDRDTAVGVVFKLERWSLGRGALSDGQPTAGYAFDPGVPGLPVSPLAGSDPWTMRDTPKTVWAVTADMGFTYLLTEGIRFGGTVDRLAPKHIGNVDERPQVRAGLQVEWGEAVRLNLESDLNAAARMPFPDKQRTSAVSLVIAANPTMTLMLGAERRQMQDVTTTRAGLTAKFQMNGYIVALGFQFGDDKPMRCGTLVMP